MSGWLATVAIASAGLLLGWGAVRRRAARTRGHPPAQREPAESSQDPFDLVSVISGLAHELRNPLSSLKINLQLLGEDLADLSGDQADCPLGRRLRQRLRTATIEASRLERTLQDFLQFASNPNLQPAAADLNVVAAELLDFFLPQLTAHGVQLHPALAADPLPCLLDVALFKQAMLNLLINAEQAMAGGGRLTVRTGCDRSRGRVCLWVADTGPGIPPDQIDKIWLAYYSTKKGGTGLGLPIARRIVKAHGGTLTVRNEPGGGCEFCIELPMTEPPGGSPPGRS